ncbi:MAG: hypothetical protein JSV00_06500 [bacterium]|nr:MAG: hypothetical protein JSV00_06500 [bacterium]
MKRPLGWKALPALFPLLLLAGCAGTFEPPPPLWDAQAYNTVAVLPMRMIISTGRPPFTSEDTERSDRMGGMMQEAISVVMRYRGYEVLAPMDLSERLMKEDDLADAFMRLAAAHGYMGGEGAPAWDEAMEGAALISRKTGADLLVLAHGQGEYHSAGENLVQSLVTGLLTKGREQYQPPPSYLSADVFFVDPSAGARLARIPARQMPYEEDVLDLSRILDRYLRRVPGKTVPGTGAR